MTARDLHCFVCFDYEEGNTDDYAFIPIFGRTTESTNTEVVEKLGSILGIVSPCDGDIVPSLCVRCFTLVNDIDFHEVKLREDMYDLKTLYQNGIDARRMGVKIKRENDNFWGDIRDEDGQSFMPISGLDGATLDELTLATAENIEREANKADEDPGAGEIVEIKKDVDSLDESNFDSGNFNDDPSAPQGSQETDSSGHILGLPSEVDNRRRNVPGSSAMTQKSPASVGDRRISQKPGKGKKPAKKRLVLGGPGPSSQISREISKPFGSDEDAEVDNILGSWSDDDEMIGGGDKDDDEDDEEAEERAMLIDDPYSLNKRNDDEDDDDGGIGGGGSMGGSSSGLGGSGIPGFKPEGSASVNSGGAGSSKGGEGSVRTVRGLDNLISSQAIVNSGIPSHIVGRGRVKTLIVREDARVGLQHNAKPVLPPSRYAYACNVCNKKLKKRDAMEEHLRMHRSTVPKQTFTLESSEGSENPDPLSIDAGDIEENQSGNLIGDETLGNLDIFSGYGGRQSSFLSDQGGRSSLGATSITVTSSLSRGGLCDLCGMNTVNLYTHKRTAHPDVNIFRCSCCQLVFTDEKRYFEHVSKESNIGSGRKYVCPEEGCGDIFTRLGPWRNHIRETHSNSRSACSKCGKVFYSSYAMVHERKCIGRMEDYPSADDYYKKKQVRRKRLPMINPDLLGLDKHENDLQFCPKCCRKVKNRYWLIVHMEKVHAPRPFQCPECGKGYQRQDQLEIHMMSHSQELLFQCDVCGKNLANPSSLKKHVSLHEGRQTKPHECDICGKRFSGRDNLNVHIRGVHSSNEDFRYICDVCGKKFPILGWLKNHLRSHTNNRPHTCSYCKKSFKEMNKLKVHERLHTGEKPYVCSLCRDGFIRAEALKKHMLKSHGIDSSKMSYLLIEDPSQVFVETAEFLEVAAEGGSEVVVSG